MANSTLSKSLSLTKSDLKIAIRRSESLLVTVVLPIVVLIGLSFSKGGLEKYLPFVFIQSCLASSLLSLGISTGFDRRYRVLVRLGTTPIGKKGIVISKIIYVFVLETMQLVLIGAVGMALGYKPSVTILLVFPFCWLASIAFSSIALIIAPNLKAETNLGVQNLTYFLFVAISAIALVSNVKSSEYLIFAKIFPSSALHYLIRYSFGLNSFSLTSFISLIVLGALLAYYAIQTFKFDE